MWILRRRAFDGRQDLRVVGYVSIRKNDWSSITSPYNAEESVDGHSDVEECTARSSWFLAPVQVNQKILLNRWVDKSERMLILAFFLDWWPYLQIVTTAM
jgi:hypothetical protein